MKECCPCTFYFCFCFMFWEHSAEITDNPIPSNEQKRQKLIWRFSSKKINDLISFQALKYFSFPAERIREHKKATIHIIKLEWLNKFKPIDKSLSWEWEHLEIKLFHDKPRGLIIIVLNISHICQSLFFSHTNSHCNLFSHIKPPNRHWQSIKNKLNYNQTKHNKKELNVSNTMLNYMLFICTSTLATSGLFFLLLL